MVYPPAVCVARIPPDGYDEPSVSPLSSVLPSSSHSGLPSFPNTNMALCTWPDIPIRTPAAPMGWNQWVKTDAPLSWAHSITAAATLSDEVLVHDGSSSSPAGSPCLARYASATAPVNRWLP
jgi:hypothetical protein